MSGAGLTHSGLYSCFKSKSDLYAEVLTCFFTDPNWKSCWEGFKLDLIREDQSGDRVDYFEILSGHNRSILAARARARRNRLAEHHLSIFGTPIASL